MLIRGGSEMKGTFMIYYRTIKEKLKRILSIKAKATFETCVLGLEFKELLKWV